MKRPGLTKLLFLIAVVLLSPGTLYAVLIPGKLFTDQQLETVGLVRSWFNQMTLNANMEEVSHVTLQDNVLFLTSESGYLQAIDCEKGTTLWGHQVGSPELTTYAPAANSKVVVVINGTTLYAFDRFYGRGLLQVTLQTQPIAGPQVSERMVFVPLMSQKVYAIPLRQFIPEQENLARSLKQMSDISKTVNFTEEAKEQIANMAKEAAITKYLLQPVEHNDLRFCVSLGVSLTKPTLGTQTLSEDFVSWTTNLGWLMVGRLVYGQNTNEFDLLYKYEVIPQVMYLDSNRLGHRSTQTKNEIDAAPFYYPLDVTVASKLKEDDNQPKEDDDQPKKEKQRGGLLFMGTAEGQILAVNNETGNIRWKFLTDTGVSERIMADAKQCFVPTQDGTLFCLATPTGNLNWEIPFIRKLIALSEKCIYAIDLKGDLRVLNKETGKLIGRLPLSPYKFHLFNEESDRIFFISADGLIQCFHEKNLTKPLKYRFSSFDIADRLAKEQEAYLAGVKGEHNLKQEAVPEALPAPAPAPAAPAAPAAPGAKPAPDAQPAPAAKPEEVDPFGEMTGEKPKAPEKKKPEKDDSNPFGDDEIF